MPKRFLALYLPSFSIQQRIRENPNLRRRAWALVGRRQGREVITDASPRAQRDGVQSGQTLEKASSLSGEMLFLPEEPTADQLALESLGESLLVASPSIELLPHAGLCLESSAAALFGGEVPWTLFIQTHCQGLGYLIQSAVADTKFTAQMLSQHRPQIASGLMREALNPLSLSVLPCSLDFKNDLDRLGLKTLGQLAQFPAEGIASRFGTEGVLMHRLARGEDPRPLIPHRFSYAWREELCLEWSAETLEPVLFALKILLDRLIARMKERGLGLVRLQIELNKKIHFLPFTRPMQSVRWILNVIQQKLSNLCIDQPIVRVAIEALETAPAEQFQYQLNDRPEVDEALEQVLIRLRAMLGEERVGTAQLRDTHRPEWAYAFISNPSAGLKLPRSPNPSSLRPTRLMSSPQSVQVDRQLGGQWRWIQNKGHRYPVQIVLGPERLSGEWWQKIFARDYYQVWATGLGRCWIFQDHPNGQFYLHGYFD